jgi:hypothetical protein
MRPSLTYLVSDAQELCVLSADLSTNFSQHLVPTTIGADGKEYRRLSYEIQAKFCSAHTEYSLWYRGVRYGTIEAEYC